jgi:hypothetical protein
LSSNGRFWGGLLLTTPVPLVYTVTLSPALIVPFNWWRQLLVPFFLSCSGLSFPQPRC